MRLGIVTTALLCCPTGIAAAAQALEPESGVVRLVAFGDGEGTCRRWNERKPAGGPCQASPYRAGLAACPRGENARQATLLRYLRDHADSLHAVLHAGDFVRFDRNVDSFAAALGPLAARFFPTTGGDQEFLAGRSRGFMERYAPHIALGDRGGAGATRCRLCYHAYLKAPGMAFGVHIVSLENPDQYGDEKASYKPHCALTHNLYRQPRGEAAARQFAWLEETLGEAGRRRAEPGRAADALIVLTHRPVPLQADATAGLRARLARAGVDLVIAGDIHVYARGEAQGVRYFVTGVTGDRLVGGCREFLPRGYADCRPATSMRHPAPECAGTECDHFLDIAFGPKAVTVRARLIDRLPADEAMDTVTWERRR